MAWKKKIPLAIEQHQHNNKYAGTGTMPKGLMELAAQGKYPTNFSQLPHYQQTHLRALIEEIRRKRQG